MIAGIFGLLFFFIVGVALRLTLETQIVMMLFAVTLIATIYMPWVLLLIGYVIGILLGVFLISVILSR